MVVFVNQPGRVARACRERRRPMLLLPVARSHSLPRGQEFDAARAAPQGAHCAIRDGRHTALHDVTRTWPAIWASTPKFAHEFTRMSYGVQHLKMLPIPTAAPIQSPTHPDLVKRWREVLYQTSKTIRIRSYQCYVNSCCGVVQPQVRRDLQGERRID